MRPGRGLMRVRALHGPAAIPAIEEAGYRAAMVALDLLMLMNPTKADPAGMLLSGLALALDEYEQLRWPIPVPKRDKPEEP
jgi:hypothetical protein